MRKRLDKILIEQGAISEQELKDALLRQKACGGRFGSHLVYYRHITEQQLVSALAEQTGCPGVVVSEIEIPEKVIKIIPKKVALARRVVPFEIDEIQNVVKIACVNPTDPELAKELGFVARGKEVELYVAAEIAINTAIARYYLGRRTSLDANLLLEIPEEATRSTAPEAEAEPSEEPKPGSAGARILLVTDEEFAAPLLQSVLERSGHSVEITTSTGDIAARVPQGNFDRVWIRSRLAGEGDNLRKVLRRMSPRTDVRFYEDVPHLILDGGAPLVERLLIGNLNLLTTLLSAKNGASGNHAGQVGGYVDALCRKLGIPCEDRLTITEAAYVHNVSEYYYGPEETSDARQTIEQSTKFLASLDYPEIVVDVLRSAYQDLGAGTESGLSLGVLGGNILTAVDLVCHSIPEGERLSLDRLEAVSSKLRSFEGKMFLSEVIEPLIQLLREEVLSIRQIGTGLQVMLYSDSEGAAGPIEMRLKREGFGLVSESSVEACLSLHKRRSADILVLVTGKTPAEARPLIEQFTRKGFRIDETPTVLVAERASSAQIPDLLELGIEDVVVLEEGLDLLAGKMRKLATRILSERRTSDREDSAAAKGRLSDMDLVDLLQALGPGRKTVRITVRPSESDTEPLIIYLNEGRIVFAELGNLTGPEAVYESFNWSAGTWSVEPVSPDDIPPANTQESNESILMEGCRLMDERVKSGHLL